MDKYILCLNQTRTFSAPSKIKIFGKYCILMPGLKGLGGGGIFCDKILFHRKSTFSQVFTEIHGHIMIAA